jgi:hypothetical protein
MTYKGDHIIQQAFIISTLSVNNSLNSLAVVGLEKEFLAPIKKKYCVKSAVQGDSWKKKEFCPCRRIRAVPLLY